jgi:alanyl-tRNA synthetase
VRVVQVGGPWSRELCGGTHVSRSSQIGLLALSGESSVGSGSRRLEALVGIEAFRLLAAERALVARLTDALKAPKDQVEARLEASLEELKTAKSKLAAMSAAALQTRIPEWVSSAEFYGATRFSHASLGELDSADELRSLGSSLQKALGTDGVAVVTAVVADKPAIVVASGEAARTRELKAGALVKLASGILGGGGGGKDDLAQGGGLDTSKLGAAVEAIKKVLS